MACRFSNLTLSGMPTDLSYLHPVCTTPYKDSLKILAADQLLGLISLASHLAHLGLVIYSTPFHFSSLKDTQVTQAANVLISLVPNLLSLTDKQLGKLPKLRSGSVLALYTYIVEVLPTHKEIATPDQVQQVQEIAKLERVAKAAQATRTRALTANNIVWAYDCLQTRGQQITSTRLQEVLAGTAPLAIIRNVKELLLDYLPENNISDSIRKEYLLQQIDSHLAVYISKGDLDTLDELAEELGTTYSVKPAPKAVLDLKVTTQAPVEVPTQEPVLSDYPTKAAWLAAKIAWSAACAK